MRFVIQRVMHSKVTINGEVRGQIGKGFMVLIGVGEEDTVEIADKMIHKMVNMRIFEDENGKTNLGLKEVGGSLLLISQNLVCQFLQRDYGFKMRIKIVQHLFQPFQFQLVGRNKFCKIILVFAENHTENFTEKPLNLQLIT